MSVIKKETSYIVFHEAAGRRYEVIMSIDHKKKNVDICANDGGAFCFLGSDPEVVKNVSTLITEAAIHAENEIDRQEAEERELGNLN